MRQTIGQAVIFDENEFAVLICSSAQKSFVGYELSEKALSMEGRFKGINSLLRRGVLRTGSEAYKLTDEYAPLLKSVIQPRKCLVVSHGIGVVYCAKQAVLVQRMQAVPLRFVIQPVTAASLAALIDDNSRLPETDEYEFMSKGIPEKDELTELMKKNKDTALSISRFGSDESLTVMRAGLCEVMIISCGDMQECTTYSRKSFESRLDEMLGGEEE